VAPPPAGTHPGDAAPDAADHHASKYALGPLPADAPFEGIVALQVALPDQPEHATARYTFYMKGKKLRWDLFSEGGKGDSVGYRVYDGADRKFYTFLDRPVVYVTDAAGLVRDAGAARDYAFTPFAMEPHGVVMGLPCDRLEADDEHYRYEVCLASGLPTLPLAVLGSSLAVALPFSATLDQRGLFPLSVVVRARDPQKGAEPGPKRPRPPAAALKVLRVERGRVPEAAFDLPAYPFAPSATLTSTHPLR
jgi:hypothetical protein